MTQAANTSTRAMPYGVFELTLMVTARCPLRCTYCYNGPRREAAMDAAVGKKAVDRAMRSLQAGGKLELGFFGGEPLLEAALIGELADYARAAVVQAGSTLSMAMTTSGTVATPAAWQVMLADDVSIAVSIDGAAAVHDRHRKLASGKGSWHLTAATLGRLVQEGKDVTTVMVLRPDTVDHLPQGLEAIRQLGVKFAQPSLDLWSPWSPKDVENLSQAVRQAADLWRPAGGGFGIGWFDDMASRLAGLSISACGRCAFGAGQVAVSPAGNLYPCERLIGQDGDDNPHRLGGQASDGEDFLSFLPAPARAEASCQECTIAHACSTYCRCSNTVRTGDPSRPDRLLCELNKMVFRELGRILKLDEGQTPLPEIPGNPIAAGESNVSSQT